MKKTIVFLGLLLLPLSTLAWDDCSYHEKDCAYPGQCGQYVDTNNNQICDHSEALATQDNLSPAGQTALEEDLITGQELKTKTVEEVAKIYKISPKKLAEKLSKVLGIKVKEKDSFQLLHDNYSLEPSLVKEIAEDIKNGKEEEKDYKKDKEERKYNFLFLVAITLFLYLLTYLLAKIQKIKKTTHLKIWNWGLLISFLGMFSLGILLTLKKEFGIIIPLPFNILFWHVELGIVMGVISLFHILNHFRYFLNIF